MKKISVYTSLLAGIFLCSTALAQKAATGSSGGTAVIGPRTGISPVVTPNGTLQPGNTIQNGTQTGVNGQTFPDKTATTQSTLTSNGVAGTNNLAGTNDLNGTNNFAGTNGIGSNNVAAMVNPTTNFNVNINSNFNGNVVIPDQAVTPADRVLLTTLSQGVRATLGITANGNTPVHFLIQNGTVTVVGTVTSTAQSQAVLSQVQQTPGVLSVVNDMHVSGPYAPAVQNGNRLTLGTVTDRAFSPADQTLLTTVQQEAALQLGVTSLSQMPVHFSIQNGVVGVTGQVSSQQEKQALIAAIGRTTGITRVVDNVSVAAGGTTTTSGNVGVSGFNNGTLTPTSRSTNQMINTNSSGF